MQTADFDYHLPPELIAHFPLSQRSSCRLLLADAASQKITHRHFYDLKELINPGDLLVFNDSRVIPARLTGSKLSGGKVEILIERLTSDNKALAHIRASKAPKPGSRIELAQNFMLEVLARHDSLFEIQLLSTQALLEVLYEIGEIPLPGYITRSVVKADAEDYQTVYAKHVGSVAAPTAGLHFDENLLADLKNHGVEFNYLTLHVGAGTFQPVRVDSIHEHVMHKEYLQVSASLCEHINAVKTRGNQVIAVGTTSVRSLETAAQSGRIQAYTGETDIFIYPGYQFQCVDAMITNFHTPRSTLLMLVAAFIGKDLLFQAYQEAIEQQYRFLSYGDACFFKKA